MPSSQGEPHDGQDDQGDAQQEEKQSGFRHVHFNYGARLADRFLRLANPSPAKPRPRSRRVVGSGTPALGAGDVDATIFPLTVNRLSIVPLGAATLPLDTHPRKVSMKHSLIPPTSAAGKLSVTTNLNGKISSSTTEPSLKLPIPSANASPVSGIVPSVVLMNPEVQVPSRGAVLKKLPINAVLPLILNSADRTAASISSPPGDSKSDTKPENRDPKAPTTNAIMSPIRSEPVTPTLRVGISMRPASWAGAVINPLLLSSGDQFPLILG